MAVASHSRAKAVLYQWTTPLDVPSPVQTIRLHSAETDAGHRSYRRDSGSACETLLPGDGRGPDDAGGAYCCREAIRCGNCLSRLPVVAMPGLRIPGGES